MQKCLIVITTLVGLTLVTGKLEEVFSWKEIDWRWPSEEARNNAIKAGEFIPRNSMPNAILRWKNKLFVTVPRWKAGVASTLNYVDLNSTDTSPSLRPYPNWESNRLTKDNENSPENITVSIFRIDVDPCDRLWVIDTGLAQIVGGHKMIKAPTLFIYDLKTDKEIRKYPLKTEQYSSNSMFANAIVDATADKCDKAFAYLPDIQDNTIVIYSFAENDSWKIKHNYFSFEPLEGDLNIAGVNFQWHDGVFAVALGPTDSEGYRTAYFHCLIGTHEFSVNTRILKNKTLATNNAESYHLYKIEGIKGENSQGTSSAFDLKKDILFLSQISKDGVGCWNTKKPLNPQNFGTVAQDHEKVVFPNDIKVDQDRNLWILSDKMPIFMYKKMDPTQINFRILKIPVDEAIKGTICDTN